MSALRELIAFFGVEVEDKKLDHAGAKMEGLAKLAESVGSTIGLAFGLHEISEFIQKQIEIADHIGNTAEILGVATDELQRFRYAALNADVEVDAADKSLRFLNKNLGEAISGNEEASKTFRDMGIDIASVKDGSKSATDLLPQIADKFQGLKSSAEQTAMAMKIFGKQGAMLLPLLKKGAPELAKFSEEFEALGGGISEGLIKQAEEGEHSLKKMRTAWGGMKATIAGSLIPAFTWLVDKLGAAVIWFRQLATHSYIVQTALGTLAVIVGALAVVWAVLNWEILLVVLAIGLLILVVDDVYTAFMGGKSVVGDFIDSLLGVGATKEIVESVKLVSRELWEELKLVASAAKGVIDAFVGVNDQSTPTKSGLEGIKGVIGAISWVAKEATLNLLLLFDTLGKIIGKFDELKRDHPSIAKAFDAMNRTFNPVSMVSGVLAAGDSVAAAAGPAQATHAADITYADGRGGDVTNHTQINVDVKTTGSPHEAGKEVAKGVQRGIDGSDMQGAYAAVPGGGGG